MRSLKGGALVFDQFKIGSNEIRGFSSTGIGPRMSNGDVLGGLNYFTASAEASFPMPAFLKIRSAVVPSLLTLRRCSATRSIWAVRLRPASTSLGVRQWAPA